MAWNRGEPFGRLFLSIFSLMLSTAGAPFWPPLLTIAQENPHKPFLYFTIYNYLCFLNPINYYLNILLLYQLDFVTHAGNPEGINHETFLMKHLPQAACTASFATLVLSTPLFAHVAITEDSVGFAIGACLVCLSLITTLSYVLKKFLNSGGFVLVSFSLCISAGSLFSLGPYVSFSDKIYLPLLFVSFITLIISITLVLLNIGTPSARRAENFVVFSLSAAIAALLFGWYLLVSVEVANVAALVVEVGEL